MTSLLCHLVQLCHRFALWVVIAFFFLVGGLGYFVATHISINTDVDGLLAEDLPWRVAERDITTAFPQKSDRLIVVLDGKNAVSAGKAAETLAKALSERTDLFKSVRRPDGDPFFEQYGLLYLSEESLSKTLDDIIEAQPILGTVAVDPSLRGVFETINLMVEGYARGDVSARDLEQPFRALTAAIEATLAGSNEPFDWQSMMAKDDNAVDERGKQRFILTQPILDFKALAPGAKASEAIRAMIKELKIEERFDTRVRLTGSVALNDDEFSSVAEGTEIASIASLFLVIGLLIVGLRSVKIVVPIVITLLGGLIATTAFAVGVVGPLNLISVAFVVMFIGIAVDFGIQFGVRFRDQFHQTGDREKAIQETARTIVSPLAIAAASCSIGFICFLPTDYRGVAELGLIASAGMVIALFFNLTLLPALITLFKPPAEKEAIGYAFAAPVNEWLLRHRRIILAATGILTIGATVVASQIRFDFDPLNLKDPGKESVATLFDLIQDPDTNPYNINLLLPPESIEQAKEKLSSLAEIDHIVSLQSFVPEDQAVKLGMLQDAALLLGPTLQPIEQKLPPSISEIIGTITRVEANIREKKISFEAALELSFSLQKLIGKADDKLLERLHAVLVVGLVEKLETVRTILSAGTVTEDLIPQSIRQDWVSLDGRYLLEIHPKGNARDQTTLIAFTDAVQKLFPAATGTPISIRESGKTVSGAFLEAAIYALLAITLLGFLLLRRALDVFYLLAPLLLAFVFSLATLVFINLPLNFANIIALPLLLGTGVSYTVYFVIHWRNGLGLPLSSSTARAVLFSAATTLVAFGSLCLSAHPGTAGMGILLTIALFYSLTCTFFVLPALLAPRKDA
jgi:uncharacterized protein